MTNTFETITDRSLSEITETSLEEILVEINCELGRRKMEKKKGYYNKLHNLIKEITDAGFDLLYKEEYFDEEDFEIL